MPETTRSDERADVGAKALAAFSLLSQPSPPREAPAETPVPVPVPEPSAGRAPSRASEILAGIHASNRTVPAVAVDVVVISAVGLGIGIVPLWGAPLWALGVVLAGYLGRMYGDRDTVQTRGMLWYPGKVVQPVSLVAFVGLATGILPLKTALWLIPAAAAGLCSVRLVSWLVLAWARQHGHALRRTLVVGTGPLAETVVRKLVEFPQGGLVPVAKVGLDLLEVGGRFDQILAKHEAEHVIVVPTHSDDIDLVGHFQRSRGSGTRFSLVPPLGDLFLHPGRVSELGGVPFIPLGRVLRTRTSFPGKRTFDLLAAGVLLLALLPVLALAAIAIKLDDGGPVFFRQRRVGKGGHTFGMLKFRSMVVGADQMQAELRQRNVTDGLLFRVAGDPRITRVGQILRRTSVDELPQLWNVLRGQMSLVGPRPLPVDPDAFSSGDSERHTVLPGITGYWQISGGNGLAYQEMITLDLAYIRNWSLWLDVRLLLRTLPALVHRHDPA